MELTETGSMNREAKLLNLVCVVAALAFVGLAVLNALLSFSFMTTDNLFVTVVCLVIALTFAANPLLYLRDEGKLPIPFPRKKPKEELWAASAARKGLPPSQPMLDAKGRAVPPDVKSMVNRMKEPQA
ncbi:MAG TPA: hypothetical protein VLL54_05225 [Pyrinomonadaceae bacterium]|nr:hypothetical protein [Pyrinomonadaceae bacterium]